MLLLNLSLSQQLEYRKQFNFQCAGHGAMKGMHLSAT